MAVIAITKVPRDLPNAHIYLDDLLEVERALQSAASGLQLFETICFVYEIDGRTRLTEHKDLLEYGGFSSHISVYCIIKHAHISEDEVLRFRGILEPRFTSPHCLVHSEWELFGRVNQVFGLRRDKLQAFAAKIPFFPLWLAGSIGLSYLSANMRHFRN